MTPEVAYLVGLFQTDSSHEGRLDGKGRVALELAARDDDVLNRIAALLPCHSSIRYRTRDTNFSENYTSAVLGFYDQSTRRSLAELGVPPGRKSRIIAPPLRPYAKADYVRGLLDGDGSVGFTGKGEPFVSLVTASPPIAEFFCGVVADICGVTRSARPNKRDGVANVLVLNVSAAKLAAWSWHSPDVLGIERKRLAAAEVASWTPDPKKAGRYGATRKRWTAEEDQIVLSRTGPEAADLLGRTAQSISVRKWRFRGGGRL